MNGTIIYDVFKNLNEEVRQEYNRQLFPMAEYLIAGLSKGNFSKENPLKFLQSKFYLIKANKASGDSDLVVCEFELGSSNTSFLLEYSCDTFSKKVRVHRFYPKISDVPITVVKQVFEFPPHTFATDNIDGYRKDHQPSLKKLLKNIASSTAFSSRSNDYEVYEMESRKGQEYNRLNMGRNRFVLFDQDSDLLSSLWILTNILPLEVPGLPPFDWSSQEALAKTIPEKLLNFPLATSEQHSSGPLAAVTNKIGEAIFAKVLEIIEPNLVAMVETGLAATSKRKKPINFRDGDGEIYQKNGYLVFEDRDRKWAFKIEKGEVLGFRIYQDISEYLLEHSLDEMANHSFFEEYSDSYPGVSPSLRPDDKTFFNTSNPEVSCSSRKRTRFNLHDNMEALAIMTGHLDQMTYFLKPSQVTSKKEIATVKTLNELFKTPNKELMNKRFEAEAGELGELSAETKKKMREILGPLLGLKVKKTKKKQAVKKKMSKSKQKTPSQTKKSRHK